MRELKTNEISIVNGAGFFDSALGGVMSMVGKVPDSVLKLIGIQSHFSESLKIFGQGAGLFFGSLKVIEGTKLMMQGAIGCLKFEKISTTTP